MAARTGRDQAAMRLPLGPDWVLGLATTFRRSGWPLYVCGDAARRLEDRRNEAGALNNLGLALQEMRRFEEATTAYQEAAAICQETGDRHTVAW